MRALGHSKRRALIGLAAAAALALLPIASAPAVLSAPDQTIDLCAKTGTLGLPDAVSVPVWGFALGDCASAGAAQVPGPVLDVAPGQVVQIVVHNDLAEAVSLEVPGSTIEEGAVEAAPGASASFRFTSASGTYVYQSPSNGGRQIGMGLYGALIVRSGTANQAYGDPSTAYDSEALLVLSALDPALNADPDGFDMLNWAPPYWLINGKAYPQTDVIHAASAGQRVLLRYVNAGFDNSAMALLGAHEQVVAQDAYLLQNPFDAVAETIPAGATMDAIVTIPATGSSFPLYNRQLHLTNGTVTSADPYPFSSPGGMMTFIQVP